MSPPDTPQGDHRVAFDISKEAYRRIKLAAANRCISATKLLSMVVEDYAKGISASVEEATSIES